jgi:hypothetical protein
MSSEERMVYRTVKRSRNTTMCHNMPVRGVRVEEYTHPQTRRVPHYCLSTRMCHYFELRMVTHTCALAELCTHSRKREREREHNLISQLFLMRGSVSIALVCSSCVYNDSFTTVETHAPE